MNEQKRLCLKKIEYIHRLPFHSVPYNPLSTIATNLPARMYTESSECECVYARVCVCVSFHDSTYSRSLGVFHVTRVYTHGNIYPY